MCGQGLVNFNKNDLTEIKTADSLVCHQAI